MKCLTVTTIVSVLGVDLCVCGVGEGCWVDYSRLEGKWKYIKVEISAAFHSLISHVTGRKPVCGAGDG